MPTKRTPAEMVAHRAAELEKSRRKLARAKDPLIIDLEHMRNDLNLWAENIKADGYDSQAIALAVVVLDQYATHRIERALSEP